MWYFGRDSIFNFEKCYKITKTYVVDMVVLFSNKLNHHYLAIIIGHLGSTLRFVFLSYFHYAKMS